MNTTAELTTPSITAAPAAILAFLEGMVVSIRARRSVRLTDATGINLANARALKEHHLGLILCDDARDAGAICAWNPARVERAGLIREMATRSRGIEKYLAGAADSAEMIVCLESNAHAGAIASWRKSPAWRKLAKSVPGVVTAMRRALGNDIEREYGAARKLSYFLADYERLLGESLTAYSHRLTGG